MIVIILLLALVSNAIPDALQDDFVEALKTIKEAESRGAEVQELVDKYNEALSIVSEINNNEFASCPSYDTCIEEINSILAEINESLITVSKGSNFSLIVYAIVAAVIASFTLTFSYKILVYYKNQRFMMKRIKVKEDE